jgi:hypothetical protein
MHHAVNVYVYTFGIAPSRKTRLSDRSFELQLSDRDRTANFKLSQASYLSSISRHAQPKPCVLTYFFVELQLHRPAAVNAWQLVG